jgi:hypothetical protein
MSVGSGQNASTYSASSVAAGGQLSLKGDLHVLFVEAHLSLHAEVETSYLLGSGSSFVFLEAQNVSKRAHVNRP